MEQVQRKLFIYQTGGELGLRNHQMYLVIFVFLLNTKRNNRDNFWSQNHCKLFGKKQNLKIDKFLGHNTLKFLQC